MRILTYDDPFTIIDNSYWSEIKDYPHLCVTETLKQGLLAYYRRDTFKLISTLQSVIDNFYKQWADSPENEIKQYVSISEQIANLKSERMKKAFKFNQRDVHQSLRFCMELGLDPKNFDQSALSEEQKLFLGMFQKLKKQEEWNIFVDLVYKDEEDLKDTFLELLNKELEQINEDIEQSRGYLKRQLKRDKKYVDQLLSEFDKHIDEIKIEAVVIHGLHQFTPITLKFIQHLMQLGIEVIFLINYQSDYPNIYRTWDEVYRWTNIPINITHKETFKSVQNHFGKAMGSLLEGEIKAWDKSKIKFYKYENLTAFSDDIAQKYETTRKTISGIRHSPKTILAKMPESYYAPNNEDINAILRGYFPEQFGDRHFLAYPIGQFILGLYNMWDEDKQTLKISREILREVLSVNFFQKVNMPTPLQIYNKIELYFSDLETFSEFIERLDYLIEKVKKINENSNKESSRYLKHFSFYHITIPELEYFKDVIYDLESITKQIFGNQQQGYVNYKKHYQVLLEIISKKVTDSPMVDAKEREFVEQIKNQFENLHDLEIEGTIEDLKETIHFYLHRRSLEDSSRWIVRNFEQIDGGVLLSKTRLSRNSKYHYCLLSDQYMKVSVDDRLPWPLTQEFFDCYVKDVEELQIVLTSYKEYVNFLRYSLFYGTYYLDNELILSYVEEVGFEESKNSPYFLLNMLGLEPHIPDPPDYSKFKIREDHDQLYLDSFDNNFTFEPNEIVELQKFVTCPYRYFLDHVIEGQGYYSNEYLSKLLYQSILYFLVKKTMDMDENNQKSNYKNIIKVLNKKLSKYFPFWKEIHFNDLARRVTKYIEDDLKEGFHYDDYYHKLRLEFLYAKISEGRNNGENLIKEVHLLRKNNQFKEQIEREMFTYIVNNSSFFEGPKSREICKYCKQKEVCLYFYQNSGDLNG